MTNAYGYNIVVSYDELMRHECVLSKMEMLIVCLIDCMISIDSEVNV
jgi:hypothetical protein